MPGAKSNALLRVCASLLLNLAQAVFGTALIEALLPHVHAETLVAILTKEYIMSATIAFGAGYFIYRRWRTAPAQWVWLAGACWIGYRVVSIWLDERTIRFVSGGTGHIYDDVSGLSCIDPGACATWILYSIPFVRTLFYSGGALCASRFPAWPNAVGTNASG